MTRPSPVSLSAVDADRIMPAADRPDRMETKYASRSMDFVGLFTFLSPSDAPIIICAIISCLAAGTVPLAQVFLLGKIFGRLGPNGTADTLQTGALDVQFIREDIDGLIIWLVVLACAAWVVNGTTYALWSILARSQAHIVRRRVLDALIHLHLSWFDSRPEGIESLASAYARQVHLLEKALGLPLGVVIQNLGTCLALMAFAFYKSWKLTIVTIAGLPVFVLVAALTARSMPRILNMQNLEFEATIGAATCSLGAVNTIKEYNAQYDELNRFRESLRNCEVYDRREVIILAIQQAVMRFGTLSMFIQGNWYGSHLVETGEINAGDVIATFYAAILGVTAITTIMPQMGFFYHASSAALVLRTFINSGPLETATDGAASRLRPEIRGDIRLRKVRFCYPSAPDRPVLNDIDIQFHAGEMHFVVGASGSGKTSLGQLLTGLYDVSSGSIDIDNLPIESICPQTLRQQICLVEQTAMLFVGSISDNLQLVQLHHHSSEDRFFSEALLFAAMDQVVVNMPGGFETQVGPQGSSLSGGQRQRIALARAFVRSPKVLILDESTSALDPIMRTKVTSALRTWRKGLTTIVITHDLGMITSRSDYVVVLEQGAVVEQGFNDSQIVTRYRSMRASRSTSGIQAAIPLKPHIPIDDRSRRWTARRHLNLRDSHYGRATVGLFSPVFGMTRIPDRETNEDSPAFMELDNAFARLLASTLSVLARFRRRLQPQAYAVKSDRPRDLVPMHPIQIQSSHNEGHQAIAPSKASPPPSIFNILGFMIKRMSRTQRIKLSMGLLSSAGQAAGTPLFSYFFGKLVGTLFGKSNQSQDALSYSLEILAVIASDSALLYLSTRLMYSTAQDVVNDLREYVLGKLLGRARSFFDRPENSLMVLIEALDHHADQLRSILAQHVGQMMTAVLLLSYSIVWSSTIAWKPALAFVACLPLIGINAGLFELLSSKYDALIVRSAEEAEGISSEICTTIKTIKLLTLQDHFIKKYEEAVTRLAAVTKKRAICCAPFYGFSMAMVNFLIALLFHFGINKVFDGEYSTTQMLQVFSLLLFGATGAGSIVASLPSLNVAKVAAGRVLRLSRLDESTAEPRGTLQALCVGDIEFEAVIFSYPTRPETQVLKNVSFKITAGSCVAIVGPSGSGKSTIASLLSKLYEPDTKTIGELPSILLGGHDITRLHTKGLRQLISTVSQKPVIFPGTVEQNIKLGLAASHPYAQSRHVTTSAILAACDSFVTTLPAGYQTIIGDGGLGLSGGQMQRIAIARALNKRPQLLILDEATSALDRDAAQYIRQTVSRLITDKEGWPNLTMIIITHDREMMKLADQIIVMDEGRKVEQGDFDDLLRLNGVFSRLYRGEAFAEEHLRKSVF